MTISSGQGANAIDGAGRDLIHRHTGSDVLFGRAGLDTILAGRGTYTIYGRPGNDTVILEEDGTRDTVHWGPGHDVVLAVTSQNTVVADCEEIHVGPLP